jgi:hypothetical protein
MQTREQILQLAFACLAQAAKQLEAAGQDLLFIRRRGQKIVGKGNREPAPSAARRGGRRSVRPSHDSRPSSEVNVAVRYRPIDSPWRR